MPMPTEEDDCKLQAMLHVLEQLSQGQKALEQAVVKMHQDVWKLGMRKTDRLQRTASSLPSKMDISPNEVEVELEMESQESTCVLPETENEKTPEIARSSTLLDQKQRRLLRLKQLFQQDAVMTLGASSTSIQAVKETSNSFRLAYLDAAMVFILLANVIIIGLSMDNDVQGQWSAWKSFDLAFSVIFFADMVFRMCLHGFSNYLFGPDRTANMLDAFLVALDIVQLILELVIANSPVENVQALSLFRIVRLMRLTRAVRLVKSTLFADLLAMLHGIKHGAVPLLWAVCVFIGTVYLGALFCRELLGPSQVTEEFGDVASYFSSVPRSSMTVFRCTFGDCTSVDGKPIFEQVYRTLGPVSAVIFCAFCSAFLLFVSFGLFNIIAAIFLESTVRGATESAKRKHTDRLCDHSLWVKNAVQFIRCLLKHDGCGLQVPGSLVDHVEEIADLDVPRRVIEEVIQTDPLARQALDELDIDRDDQRKLAKILDAGHSGRITMMWLVNGLSRLRGLPARSDTISVEFCVQAMQTQIHEIREFLAKRMGAKDFSDIRQNFRKLTVDSILED
eukprot:TRINITY_DN5614_c0_g1_i2.p1 TRINITY_DN5614_c0_g1~~TRINITY_DN5614_c0_g1_i2.p1  ORF type:complete len:583 (+),score=82.26 TRINITY_DN5614_c0_g1_i2:61-1749(+)